MSVTPSQNYLTLAAHTFYGQPISHDVTLFRVVGRVIQTIALRTVINLGVKISKSPDARPIGKAIYLSTNYVSSKENKYKK